MEINKIYNENCLDTMAKMPDNFIDLTVTSPPYDGLRTYNGYSFPFEDIAKELYRVTKIGGVVVWVVGDETKNGSESGTSFKQALYFMECGFNLHDTMFYGKRNYMPSNQNRYCQQVEYCFVLSKGSPKTFNPITDKSVHAGKILKRTQSKNFESASNRARQNITNDEKVIGNYWEFDVGTNCTTKDSIAFNHPAIFPELLAYNHILSWSNENDLVYDCFMGSGTTAKAAISANRNWIGSEISKEYCQIIEQRLEPLRNNLFSNCFEKAKAGGQKNI